MRIQVECVACFVRQGLETVARASSDAEVCWQAVRRVCAIAGETASDITPPELAERVYDAVAAVTGISDPFIEEKHRANEIAMGLRTHFESILADAQDPLLAAIKFSIAGNSMDLGIVTEYGDVGALAEAMLAAPLGIDDYEAFRHRLSQARHVVMIGDNNGEVVFDRLLIEQMKKVRGCRYTYVVRGRPVINDVTAKDAHAVGIDLVADVADTGSGMPGLVLSACSPEARRLFATADLVVSKGQGNYEALSEAPRDVFFLLMVKCQVVSRDLRAPVGVAVVKHHEPL
ncbi:MAG: DUF89 family protein [Dehalococcoidia bacterium]|nr:DUF89 family protein [Dehalococcoidia bacterium]